MSDERACQSCVARAQNACFLEGRATDGRPLLKFSPLVNGSIAAGGGEQEPGRGSTERSLHSRIGPRVKG
jgi:hypothetical protein